MASWAAVLALTGFRWSAVTGTLELAPRAGRHFWSNGSAWGTFLLEEDGPQTFRLRLTVTEGELGLAAVRLAGFGSHRLPSRRRVAAGETLDLNVRREGA
jgi:hypothetical protein